MTEQQKLQVAAYNSSGSSIDEIAAETGIAKNALGMNKAKEKEPVPVAAETSSEVVKDDTNSLHPNNSRILSVCQENLDRAAKDMLSMYERMTPEEKRAWDLGEIFGSISRALGEFV